MNDRFKFRAKTTVKDNLKRDFNYVWTYGDLMHSKDKIYIHPYCNHFQTIGETCRLAVAHEIIPETIGQCTGLKDINGKLIFEGDIVTFGQIKYQITFECGSFALLDKKGEMISKIGGINDHCYSLMNLHLECCWEDNFAYDLEIIGNRFDNPELLEV